MNILIVPSWYKNEINPVLGSFFREQALALLKKGHQVYVADATFQSVQNLRSKRLLKLCKFDDQGLTTYSLVAPTFGLLRTGTGGVGLYYRNLQKIYRALAADGVKVDLIHAHAFFPAGIAATRLGKKFHIPVVVTEHNSLVLTGKLHPKRIPLLQETVENADRFICVSDALKEAVIRLTQTHRQIDVIPNLVDSLFRYNEKTADGPFTFISTGNLVHSKRFDLTLRAFAGAFGNHPSARLVIIGDGILKEDLQQLAADLGISDAVDFKGRLPREAVLRELHKSDVFVLPSDFETFGVVYIEALASGRPVIATRNGGADTIITETNGILIDTDSEPQLRSAMLQIRRVYDRYDLPGLSEACRTLYGEESVAERISALYEQVVSRL